MKLITLLVLATGYGILAEAGTNEIATFAISAEDVIQNSIWVHPTQVPNLTNRFTVKFQYTESASNRVRAFTAVHQNQMVRDKIGEFTTTAFRLQDTNTSGRMGYWGISKKDANAIVSALKKP